MEKCHVPFGRKDNAAGPSGSTGGTAEENEISASLDGFHVMQCGRWIRSIQKEALAEGRAKQQAEKQAKEQAKKQKAEGTQLRIAPESVEATASSRHHYILEAKIRLPLLKIHGIELMTTVLCIVLDAFVKHSESGGAERGPIM